jgi:hypothetical protein
MMTTDLAAEELWILIYDEPPPEKFGEVLRAWVYGYHHTEAEIIHAITTAAEKTHVDYDMKIPYAAGVLRRLRAERGEQ